VNDSQRAALRAQLLASGIAGDTKTPRSSVVGNAEKLAAGDPDKRLGIGARGRDFAGVMRAVAELCGCDPACDDRGGPGVIDPDKTLDAVEALGDRLAAAGRAGARMLVATGHPTGLLPLYQAIARALAAAGAKLETPRDSEILQPPPERGHRRKRKVIFCDSVGVLSAWPDLVHTHESWPMDALLDAIPAPDLVLADHGFAGAAIARGVETVCFTDVNDPAIAVAAADGLVRVVVPCDDNLPPVAYEPVRDYLTDRIARG
jgi:hypothetical protein